MPQAAEKAAVTRMEKANGHNRRKAATRKALMSAARKLFSEASYDTVTLHDVARATGYTRQTVYTHFHSKWGLLQAIAEPIFAIGDAQHAEFAKMRDPTPAQIEDWLWGRVRMLRENIEIVRLLWQATAYDPEGFDSEYQRETRVIEVLAEGHPAFARALSGPSAALVDVKARLLLQRMDAACLNVARGWKSHSAYAIGLIAQEFHAFMTDED